jgi:hypothetical protein
MARSLVSCAPLCRSRALRVIAVVVALAGCGGSLASPVDGGSSEGSSPPPAGCPSIHDIDTEASVGKACTPEGTYCLNPACDPCTKNCPAVKCAQGVWATAINTALCTGTPDASVDTGTAPDAAVCIDIDPTTFDNTCNVDADCMAVTGGTFCGNGPWCMCLGATINVDGQTRYQAEIADLESRIKPGPGGCTCPFFGSPRCNLGHCALCGGAAGNEGCPDGG